MRVFNEGDMVTIVSNLEVDWSNNVVEEMVQHQGKQARIMRVCGRSMYCGGDYKIDVDGQTFYWYGCNFVEFHEAKNIDTNFNIGDILQTKKVSGNKTYIMDTGSLGIVIDKGVVEDGSHAYKLYYYEKDIKNKCKTEMIWVKESEVEKRTLSEKALHGFNDIFNDNYYGLEGKTDAHDIAHKFIVEELERIQLEDEDVEEDDSFQIPEIKLYDESIIEEMIGKVDKIQIIRLFSLHVNFKDAKKNIDNVLRKWAINKSHIYKALGNNLKITDVKKVELSDSMIREKRKELKGEFPQYEQFIDNLTSKHIKHNSITSPCGFLKEVGAKEGMKITKLAHQLYEREEFDIALSKLTQEKECDRYFHVSIDPLDILMMSINNSDWSSCHHFDHGDWNVGCLVYMYDNCSLIAYASSSDEPKKIKVDDKMEIKAINKCWRQMLGFDENTLGQFYGRQYPNESSVYASSVRSLFASRVCDTYGCENKWIRSTANDSHMIASELEELYYNDVSRGATDHGKVLRLKEFSSEIPKFHIGHNDSDKLMCMSCDDEVSQREYEGMCEM